MAIRLLSSGAINSASTRPSSTEQAERRAEAASGRIVQAPTREKTEFCVMATIFYDSPLPVIARRPLTEDDAVDIWIARWLRIRPIVLQRRYACDPRRLYEIWEEARFPGTRSRALAEFAEVFPRLEPRFDPGPHRRIPVTPHPDQLSLFSEA